MTETIEIYGTKIQIKAPAEGVHIEDWGYPDEPENQYWRRFELPSFFNVVDYDREGNAILNPTQRKYAQEEVRRCKEGFYFLNNGIVTYITGKHYFYLQWWKLEDDIYGDYRDTDRRYFIYLNHWENVLWCLGIVRGKKRREGATSQATSNLVYECVFYKNSICGLTSKTQTDAKSAFTNMIAFGYRQLPVFLKPKQLNNRDSVSELVFAHKSTDVKGGVGSAIDSDTGHRSKVDYRAPSTNAYDSGRISRGCFDEGGKWPKEVPFSKFIAIVSKTMVKGAKRVGFMECPSTVNEMTKSGGDEYKKVWDSADQIKHERTPNRLVRYFTPAFDGYYGFIDRHGISVIDPPTESQFKYLVENFVGIGDITEEDIKLGSKGYLIAKRALLEGVELEEEIRMNPFDEKEMFLSADTGSLFNSFLINEQLDWLTYHEMTEKGDLVWENGDEFYTQKELPNGDFEMKPSKLIWVSNANGKYEKVIGWLPKEPNNVIINNGSFSPNAKHLMSMGGDPFKYDKTKNSRKSDCAVYGFQLADLLNENDPFNDMFAIRYVERAATTDLQYYHALKMAWWCGCQILWERNVDGWIRYFREKKCGGFLRWMAGEVTPGIHTDPNVIQVICDIIEAYIEKNIKKVYFKTLLEAGSGWLGFSATDTEESDETMSSGFTLIDAKSRKRVLPTAKNYTSVEKLIPYRKAG